MFAYRENLKIREGVRACSAFVNECAEPKCMVSCHWHDAYEVLFVRAGQCIQKIGSNKTTLSAGAISIVSPGDLHETVALTPCAIDVLHFYPELSGIPLPSAIIARPALSFEKLSNRFENLKEACLYDDIPSRVILSGAVRELTGQLMRIIPAPASRNAASQHIAELVTDCLKAEGDMSLVGTAKRLGYTPEYLSRCFHSETGITFREYTDQLRMRYAISLMRNASSSIENIAVNAGYSGAASFVRAFRRMYGMTPARYRSFRMSDNI